MKQFDGLREISLGLIYIFGLNEDSFGKCKVLYFFKRASFFAFLVLWLNSEGFVSSVNVEIHYLASPYYLKDVE